MRYRIALLGALSLVFGHACDSGLPEDDGGDQTQAEGEAETVAEPADAAPAFEIAPGLTARILNAGAGDTAAIGDNVEVHYTGWLFDPIADANRGNKFDSSRDRGQRFEFTLGAGRVIRGWEQGVAGMRVGEVRELTIAPELAYGERGYSDVIPPAATLVFEIELFGAESAADTATR